MPDSNPIRVLIAEDQTLMCQGLKTILDLEDGFEVAGEAADGQQAIECEREVLRKKSPAA